MVGPDFLALALLFLFVAVVSIAVREALLRKRLDSLARQVTSFRFWRIETVPPRMGALRNIRLGWRALALLVDEGHQLRLRRVKVLRRTPDDLVFDKAALRARLYDEDGLGRAVPMWALLETAGSAKGAPEPIFYWTLLSPRPGVLPPSKDDLIDCFRQMFPDAAVPQQTAEPLKWQQFKGAIWLGALVGGVCLWAALDTFLLNTWSLVPSSLVELIERRSTWWGLAAVAVLGSAAAYGILKSVPLAERQRLGWSLAIGLLIPLLALPVIKRVDQLLGSGPVESAEYVRQADGGWHPVDVEEGLPVVDDRSIGLVDGSSVETGDRRIMRLLHGALGLWQVESGSVAELPFGQSGQISPIWVQLLFVPTVLFLQWWFRRRFRRQLTNQQHWVDASQRRRFWRVALARPAYRQRWFNLLPQESLGVLADEGQWIRIRGQWPDETEPFDLLVDKKSAQLRGQADSGGNWRRQGWIEIHTAVGPILFTPQTLASSMFISYEGHPTSSEDLLRTLFPERIAEVGRGWPFALESNAWALVVSFVSLVGLTWAGIDTYALNPFELADGWLAVASAVPWFAVGVLVLATGAAGVAASVLTSRAVPKVESWALAVLLAVACVAVATPLFKRLDIWLSLQEPHIYSYVVDKRGNARRLPVGGNADTKATGHVATPPIEVHLRVRASMPVPEASTVDVEWIQGASGLWQFNRRRAYGALIRLGEKASLASPNQ